jgi:uncharacterized protein (DUF1697 family)
LPRFVCFLRAINVGGHTVTMADLRALFESQFSNVVFERALKTKATWRSLNTVVRLSAKYPG